MLLLNTSSYVSSSMKACSASTLADLDLHASPRAIGLALGLRVSNISACFYSSEFLRFRIGPGSQTRFEGLDLNCALANNRLFVSFKLTQSSKIPPNGLLPREQRHVGVTYDRSVGAGLVSWSSNPFVSTMNPPPQIGSRVRWWNSRGQLMHGTVRNINVLSDNSHIVVIQVEADQEPSTVSLPLDHVQPA
ncbi:hypothetical protein EDB83DRAFT_1760101 [Lactarius deliciosus]|nr:hypothetical protein EDB83DRAFT_1760101 [Lactarius deliciosus]